LVRLEVVEHKGGEHSVEGLFGIRKLIRKPFTELDGDRRSFRFASGTGEGLRVRIESNYDDIRVQALDQHDETAGAAPDVENAVTRANGRLFEKRSPRSIDPK
jgi:hypothetical protein